MASRLNIVAVVLAAGLSSRMGKDNKLLMDFDGVPMVVRTLEKIRAAGIETICVVTGHQAGAVERALEGMKVNFVENPDYALGLSTSVRSGIAALGDDVDGALMVLGDMPLVSRTDIAALLAAFKKRSDICQPVWDSRKGNPVLWGADYFAALQALTGDKGARELLRQYHEQVIAVEATDNGILRDFDSREALDNRS